MTAVHPVPSDPRAQLEHVARLLADSMPSCSMASVTLVERATLDTVAATDPAAVQLDHAQYDEDSGPCLTAHRTREPVTLSGIVAGPGRYERFRWAAADLGVTAAMSIPLEIDGRVRGSLNCYGTERAFGDDDQQVGLAVARFTAHLLAGPDTADS